jgi:hypothetical protein
MDKISFSVPADKKISSLDSFGHKLQQIVMPIVVIESEEIKVLGTGFVVNRDGIMITAKHVISDYLPKSGEKVVNKDVGLYALYVTNEPHVSLEKTTIGGFIPITIAWYNDQLDIAYCGLQLPIRDGEPLKLSTLGLSPGIPKIGQKILAFGYYGSTAKLKKEQLLVEYSQNTGLTPGKIIEVHPQSRDTSFLSFPCFQTDALFKSGMSGGPVFTENGAVCGVVCSGVETQEEQDSISYASLIWPTLAMPLTVNFKAGEPLQNIRVYELIKKGLIPVDDTFAQVELDTSDKEIAKIIFHH